MKMKYLLVGFAFLSGYVANDIVHSLEFRILNEANADVAGMSHRDLRRDRDFKKAVRYVVSGTCYVDGGYVYC
jgi:hypothetical protein